MNIKTSRLVTLVSFITFTVIIFSFGCSLFSSGPDEKTVQDSFYQKHKQELLAKDLIVADFKITSKYKKEINKETVYIYETEYKLKNRKTGQFITAKPAKYKFGLIKRWRSWDLVERI